MFPAWWSPSRRSVTILQRKKIRNTRDLILEANPAYSTSHVGVLDPVSIPVADLYEYCNTQLGGVTFCLRNATTEEPELVITGRRPSTVISHMPSSPTAVDDVYGWTDEELHALPEECYCPITMDVLEDPVVAADGVTYEKKAIVQWFESGRVVSPMSNEPLTTTMLFPNRAVRQQIARLTA